MDQFDLIVIGSGGGTKLVRPVANLGKKVAIIEKEHLGGTCLNRGCIPSKMLIHTADLMTEFEKSKKFDVFLKSKPEVDFEALIKRVNETVKNESDSIKPLYHKTKNLTLFEGSARFIKDKVIAVGDHKITAKRIVLATGAEAMVPDIKGLKETPYITYRQALTNTEKPKKLIVIGAGYIAVELGYFFQALGVEVHFIIRSELLRREDQEVKEEFTKSFEKRFTLHKSREIESVSYEANTFCLKYKNFENKSISVLADQLLVATGIKPNTDQLGLENTDITVDERGFVKVDQMMKTTADDVFAIGDCVGNYLFRHSVNFEGEYLFNALYTKEVPEPIEYPFMPHAVFTTPQVASIGPTEEVLKAQGVQLIKGICKYSDSAMGMALRSDEGFVKLLFEKMSKKLIAAHIIGHEASSLIHILMAFIRKKASLDDIADMIYIHPALPEIVRNAARDAKKNAS